MPQFKKTIHSFLTCFLIGIYITSIALPPSVYAQQVSGLPVPGMMVQPSEKFHPLILKGMKIDPAKPLEVEFIFDAGDSSYESTELKEHANRLVNYFLATMTVPKENLWVNLSPYEQNRIIPNALGLTEMGRDLLAQDYILKQLTASLMHPESDTGALFWKAVKDKTGSAADYDAVLKDTFHKIWIVPDEAVVFQQQGQVFIIESRLKVMTDQDFLALDEQQHAQKLGLFQREDIDSIQKKDLSTDIVREILVPVIEKEVNEGKNFAQLRQIYHSMILALWYKQNMKRSVLGQLYSDQNKLEGIRLSDEFAKNKIYNQYMTAFQKGVYDYVKEDYDPLTQQIIPRKYFSGGFKGDETQLSVAKGPTVRTTAVSIAAGFAIMVNFGCQSDQVAQFNDGAQEFLGHVTEGMSLGMINENSVKSMENWVKALGAVLTGQELEDPYWRTIKPTFSLFAAEDFVEKAVNSKENTNDLKQEFNKLSAEMKIKIIELLLEKMQSNEVTLAQTGNGFGFLRGVLPERQFQELQVILRGQKASPPVAPKGELKTPQKDEMMGAKEKVGGIDMNSDLLKMDLQGQDFTMNFPDIREFIGDIEINGFQPQIQTITPFNNMVIPLGAAVPGENIKEDETLSRN